MIVVLNVAPRHEDIWRNEGITPRVLNLRTRSDRLHARAVLASEKEPLVRIQWENGLAPRPIWTPLRIWMPTPTGNRVLVV
jgi:hypothetical protein